MFLKTLKIFLLKFKTLFFFLGFLFFTQSHAGRLPSPDEPYLQKNFHESLGIDLWKKF